MESSVVELTMNTGVLGLIPSPDTYYSSPASITAFLLLFIQLIDTLFSSMTSSFGWNNDLQLFLNVINGCIILHCEDTALLRFCLASLINTSRHFKHIFSMNGSVSTISFGSGHVPSFTDNFQVNRNSTSRKKDLWIFKQLKFKVYFCRLWVF